MEKIGEGAAGQLIKAAIESGVLKFNGPSPQVDLSKKAAEADAAYILELFTRLTTGLSTDPRR